VVLILILECGNITVYPVVTEANHALWDTLHRPVSSTSVSLEIPWEGNKISYPVRALGFEVGPLSRLPCTVGPPPSFAILWWRWQT